MKNLRTSRLLAMFMFIAMMFTLLPLGLSAATANEWDISKSKTATNLNTDFLSQVTLSLPSAEEQLVTDVVFVLDESSCSEPVKAEVALLLESLYQQVANTGAKIKIGAVQFRGEVTKLELTTLTEETKSVVTDFMSNRPEVGGTNMSAGLIVGKAMLDADTSVDSNRKYLILVSDGITYIWDDEATEEQENYGVNFSNTDTPSTPMLAGPDAWDVKYGKKYIPENWKTHFDVLVDNNTIENTIKEKASIYVRDVDISGDKFVNAKTEVDLYASTVDIALYKSYIAFNAIKESYPHSYVVVAGKESDMATFPFGPSFMTYLADNKPVDFSTILNDIIYLVDNTSYVEDYIGYTADYNFDFLNDISKISLTVGGEALTVTQIDDNTYGFGTAVDKAYPYELIYTYGDGKNGEHFVWNINVPVTNFEQVQLSYYVKLANPQTEPGTYGTYDIDGSKGYKGLYTNNSAILYPVDSTSAAGTPEAFPRPTVSYTVGSMPEPEPGEPEIPIIIINFVNTIIQKIDSENGAPLAGAEFALYKSLNDTKPFRTGVTDANGQITFDRLNENTTYYLIETKAPEGYVPNTTVYELTTGRFSDRTPSLIIENDKTEVPSALESGDHFAYIVGYPDGNVRPIGNITRAEVATIFFRLLTEEVRNENMTWDNPFSDVNVGDWYDCAISTLYAMGIINGYPDGTFDPNGFITRAEFAAIAARFDEIGNDFEESFGDVYGHWAEDEIAAAKAHGWLTGYEDGTFKPDQLITRAEAMTIVNRVLNRIPASADALLDDMVKWPDNADIDEWYYLAVQEATNSHFYERTDDNKEIWTEIREPRDWTELEK